MMILIGEIWHFVNDLQEGNQRPPSLGFHNIVIIVSKVIYSRIMILHNSIHTYKLTTI